jgi:hypothetical protein
MKGSERRHCPHGSLRGIYGDEINHTPGYRRLQCRDCGRFLDGPAFLSVIRDGEHELMTARAVRYESTEQYPCCDVPGGPERCGDCPLDRAHEPTDSGVES